MIHPSFWLRSKQRVRIQEFCILVSLFVGVSAQRASAGWVFLPESYHQLYQSWGLYFDEQSTLTQYGQGRIWTALGGTMPIVGNEEAESHPQVVFHASANAALHYSSSFRLWTETMDARLGLAFEWAWNPQLRFSIGYSHFSGHSADGIYSEDSSLIEPAVGQEFIPIRAVYDLDRNFRFSATLSPVVRSFPAARAVWADQSLEYFPWGGKDDPHSPSPYVSFGVSEAGMDHYIMTYHAQIGAYFGNHFSKGHRQTLRCVAGYYSGADPRLKYFEIRNAKQDFAYLGMMFDL